MQKLILQLLISITLVAGQAVSASALADSNRTSGATVLALVQPSAAQIPNCKNAVRQEEARLLDASNLFVPGATIYTANIGGDEAARLAKDGVYVGPNSGNNYIDLQGGNILLHPEKDIVIGTRLGKIYVGADATVFVINSGEDIVVYDLLQTKTKQVTIATNNHKFAMEPGRMFVLTAQSTNDFEKLAIDCHRVAYRNPQSLSANDSRMTARVFAADFSIASAMVAIQPLKKWTVSNNREDKVAVEKMLKSAVLLGDFATSPSIPAMDDYSVTAAQTDKVQLATEK